MNHCGRNDVPPVRHPSLAVGRGVDEVRLSAPIDADEGVHQMVVRRVLQARREGDVIDRQRVARQQQDFVVARLVDQLTERVKVGGDVAQHRDDAIQATGLSSGVDDLVDRSPKG